MSNRNRMKAAVVVEHDKLEIKEISVPTLTDYDALVKIEVCGICGTTDRQIVKGCQAHHPADWYPAVLGHEAIGRVIEIGKKVKSFKVGDRVTRPVAVWPGTQNDGIYSAWGGFAEYGIVRDRTALIEAGQAEYEDDYMSRREYVIPENISSIDASLAISLSEAASWAMKLGDLKDKTVVVGGGGMFGTAIANFIKIWGAKNVIVFDISDKAIERASQICDVVINPNDTDLKQAVSDATNSEMADYFIEATGVDSVFNQGLGLIKEGGCVAIYGAPVGYKYTLGMKNGPENFSVRLISCEDYLAFENVCNLMLEKTIDPEFYRSHVWKGLNSLPEALKQQEQGNVIKGMIIISDISSTSQR